MQNEMKRKLGIYVFSYNRGQFLQNCLKSIGDLAGNFPVTVIDDSSTDKETIDVLKKYENDYHIVLPKTLTSSEYKTGGLYSNMRLAVSDAKNHQYTYVVFIQDDMQFVRRITANDIENIESYFEHTPYTCQLQTCFLKKYFYRRDRQNLQVDPSGKAYFRASGNTAFEGFSAFSAVGVFNIQRFENLLGGFKQGEYLNNEFAQSRGIVLGLYRFPFMMWLPFPISNRGKTRDWPLRIIEHLGNCGYYPYQYLSKDLTSRLLEASPESLPVAEDYLTTDAGAISETWSFAGGLSNLRAQKGWKASVCMAADYLQKFRN